MATIQRPMSATPTGKAKPSFCLLSAARGRKTTKAERRRSLPPTLVVTNVYEEDASSIHTSPAARLSAASLAAYDRHRAGYTPSPPTTPRSYAASESTWGRDTDPGDLSVHRLRSNSGLALHTNYAALRRYTDYNMDGSSRLPPTDEHSSSDIQASQTGLLVSSTASDMVSLFSRDTVYAVLEDAEARRRLQVFSGQQGHAQAFDFLDKVEEYNKALHGVTALMANISTSFTSVGATQPLNLPKPLARALNSDIKQVSSSILPGLDNLFGEAGRHVEQRIIREIYPAFAHQQITRLMKASLGATSAHAAQTPFRFSGLGHAFCLTDPYRTDNPIVYASDSFARVLGYARAEDIPRTVRFVQDTPLDGASEFTEAIMLSRSRWDNQPFWSLVSSCPLRSASGRVRFVLSSIVNVSESLKTQEDILKALRTAPAGPSSATSDSTGSIACSSSSNTSTRSATSSKADTVLTSMTASSVFSTAEPASRPADPGACGSRSPRGWPDYDDKSSKMSSHAKFFLKPFSRKRQSHGVVQQRHHHHHRTDMGGDGQALYSSANEPRPDTGRSLPAVPSQPLDDSSAMYAQFMVLQFVPESSLINEDGSAPPPPPIARSSRRKKILRAPPSPPPPSPQAARLGITFCSPAMLELLGLSSGAQDAILYHDVFSVLADLAGSPSITSLFKVAVRQRVAASEPASMELSIPAGGSAVPSILASTGLGGGATATATSTEVSASVRAKVSRRPSMLIIRHPRDPDDGQGQGQGQHEDSDMPFTTGGGSAEDEWWNVRSTNRRRNSGTLERPERPEWPQTAEARGREASPMQRMMSHWTPLKDAGGSVAWVMLALSPVAET